MLPVFSGGLATPLYDFSMRSGITTGGFVLMGWAVLGMLSVILLRSTAAWRRWAMPAGFGVFLALVGMISVAAYPLGCNLEVGAPPVLRYLHLSLFIPIGLCAAYLARERHSGFRAAAVLVCVVWAGVNLADNVRLIHAVRSAPEENPHRELADYLMASGVRYARAGFWDAYAVTFLSGERVIVEPHAPSRIPEYRRAVEAAGADAVTIVRRPCEADVLIAGVWCIEPAPHLR